jgi:porin
VHGGSPSDRVGDVQGVSNIAAPPMLRLHELWLRQRLFQDRLSVLAGIYDINSTFDVLETAALFLNSSSGMGPEFAHSGPHGAPTYPYPGLSLLIRARLSERLEWSNLLADGTPGDPEDPGGTRYRIGTDQGWLIGSELAWVTGREVLELYPSSAPRWEARRLRMGAGPMRRGVAGPGRGLRARRLAAPQAPEARTPDAEPVARYYGKIALGLWHNTASLTLPPAPGQAGEPITRQGSGGAYLLAERSFSNRQLPSLRSWSGHLRIGVADGRSEQIDRYAGFGLVYTCPIAGASPDQIGVAVTAARLSRTYVDRIGIDQDARRWEIGIEWTIRLHLTEWLALQPDLQYIIHPGFDPDRAHALVAGLRLDLAR